MNTTPMFDSVALYVVRYPDTAAHLKLVVFAGVPDIMVCPAVTAVVVRPPARIVAIILPSYVSPPGFVDNSTYNFVGNAEPSALFPH